MDETTRIVKRSKEPFHYRHRNFVVGLFIVVPLVVIPVFIVYTFFKTDLVERWCNVYVRYETGVGLEKGTAVNFSGMKIGMVQNVSLNDSGFIDVTVGIRQQYAHFIHHDSRAILKQKNMVMGDFEIELTPGSPESPKVQTGDTLSTLAPFKIEGSLKQVASTVETVNAILNQISSGQGTVGRLIMEDSLMRMLHQTLRTTNTLLDHLDRTMTIVDTTVTRVSAIGKDGRGIIDSVTVITGKVSRTLDKVDGIVDNVGLLSKDAPVMLDDIQRDIRQADIILQSLRQNPLIKGGEKIQSDPMLYK